MTHREEDKWFKLFGVAWILCALLVLGFWAAVIYVALHFIIKVW